LVDPYFLAALAMVFAVGGVIRLLGYLDERRWRREAAEEAAARGLSAE